LGGDRAGDRSGCRLIFCGGAPTKPSVRVLQCSRSEHHIVRGRCDPVDPARSAWKYPVDPARSALPSQGAFADDNRGAADMRGHQATLVDLELHVHLSRPLHLPALAADESR
jgi:hypothetical protein